MEEVYSEDDDVKLLRKSEEIRVSSFKLDPQTDFLYDVENADEGVIIRNRWKINYYDDDLNLVNSINLTSKISSQEFSKSYLRKEGNNLYLIRTVAPRNNPDLFKEIEVYIIPIEGDNNSVKEIHLEVPNMLEVNSVYCTIDAHYLVLIGKKLERDNYYFLQYNLNDGVQNFEELPLPSTARKDFSDNSHQPWEFLFSKDDHIWFYEFYTTNIKDLSSLFVAHVVKVDMHGNIINEQFLDLSAMSSEMSDLFSFSPGIAVDKENEKLFIAGPCAALDQSEDKDGYLYFLRFNMNTGATEKSFVLNASTMSKYIPEKFQFEGLKTISTRQDPTELRFNALKLRPMFFDALNQSVLIDIFHGSTGFGAKNDITFKTFRIILDRDGELYRFGIVDDYECHFQHDRFIKYIEPGGYKSKYWGLDGDPRMVNYKSSGYELLTESVFAEWESANRILATIINKKGFDIVVMFEERNFRTTIYKTK